MPEYLLRFRREVCSHVYRDVGTALYADVPVPGAANAAERFPSTDDALGYAKHYRIEDQVEVVPAISIKEAEKMDIRQRHVYKPHVLRDTKHCDHKSLVNGRMEVCGRTRAEHMSAEEIAALPEQRDLKTLGNYRDFATDAGMGKAVAWLDKKIAEESGGRDAVVIQAESQMLYLLAHLEQGVATAPPTKKEGE